MKNWRKERQEEEDDFAGRVEAKGENLGKKKKGDFKETAGRDLEKEGIRKI
ncbi:hypothetical protein CCACVL1_03859 [Corchorus capsularis]|uniref:Uncharacterized protein n=1 Tax=Corchorus capsularis TaxID=210143 RepID=A0A1R3JWS3_COCAP|nr:hypothetical protein CCACVL1_03859 [Corchorus capsularis]